MGNTWGSRKSFPRLFCFSFLIIVSALSAHGKVEPVTDGCVAALQAPGTIGQEERELWRPESDSADVSTAADQPNPRKGTRGIELCARRAIIFAGGFSVILASGIAGYEIANFFSYPGMREALPMTCVTVSTGVLLNILSPLIGRGASATKQLSMKFSKPGPDDDWGQMHAKISENGLEVTHLKVQHIISLKDFLKKAGKALRRDKLDSAGKNYVDALLISFLLFKGLHVDDPAIILTVRSKIPDDLDSTTIERIQDAVRKNLEKRADEIKEIFGKSETEFLQFSEAALQKWFSAD